MSYTAVDLLNKAIYIVEHKRKLYYSGLEKLEKKTIAYILTSVIIKSLDESIDYYGKLKEKVITINEEEIGFVIYDKISFLINEFNQRMITPDTKNIKDIMNSFLNFRKRELALYIDVRGRLVKSEKDTETQAYKVLCDIITKCEIKVESLEKLVEKYC